MFTYAIGEGIWTGLLEGLACQFDGIMFQFTDTAQDSEIATVMRGYYEYISEGVSITNPVWTEPYDDAFGFGRLVTVSMPIYYEESGIRTILGVAGIDVLYSSIEFGMTEAEVVSKLINNAPCVRSNLTACRIEELRGSHKCGVANCTSTGTIA